MLRSLLCTAALLLAAFPRLQAQTQTPADGDWTIQYVTLRNTPEADYMIRVGDIDNLGFGFPEGFDPFCERATEAHYYPWDPVPGNAPGTDYIMMPSSFKGGAQAPCSHDGYSDWQGDARPVPVSMSLSFIKGAIVHRAVLQLFLDDFQAPDLCSRFQLWLNDKRFVEGERKLNALRQTGPIGKVVSFPLPPDMLELLKGERLTIRIDDPVTGAGDGFAIDFAKLLINPKATYGCRGSAAGRVLERDTETPIAQATVELMGYGQVRTDAQGRFRIDSLPSGLHPLTAYASGYNSGTGAADVWPGGEEEVLIYLDPASKSASYNGRDLREGESVQIYNIQFDLGSAAIRPDAKTELNKIRDFLSANPSAEIELSGHTSSDGDDAQNKALSLKRVQSCKTFLVQAGIDEGRILTVGYGEERPVSPNDTETNRAKNRRVEMRVLKL
ncbi:MAG: OmpA family protein [Bacteroidia bacterium]|nr:OmpA family protein [Bacteroidia bacterium]